MITLYSLSRRINTITNKPYRDTISLHKARAEKIYIDGILGYRIIMPDGSKGGTFPAKYADELIPLPGAGNQVLWGHNMEELVQYAQANWEM